MRPINKRSNTICSACSSKSTISYFIQLIANKKKLFNILSALSDKAGTDQPILFLSVDTDAFTNINRIG